MKQSMIILFVLPALFTGHCRDGRADSRGDDLAEWLDVRGQQVWGELPEPCDDLTFARRVYLDVLGRVPSVSELRDFQDLPENRRTALVDQVVFSEGPRADTYRRLSANNFARQWQRVLVPPGTTTNGSPETVVQFLAERYRSGTAYDELIAEFAGIQTVQAAGSYYQLVGALPQNYAGHLSRVALGVRVECAQCHDHPFNDWKQTDFWGLAAFFGDLSPGVGGGTGSINYEGTVYPAKFLGVKTPLESTTAQRTKLAEWMTSADNDYFSATAVNRFWQQFVGRGLYADVENLDRATPEERAFLDEFGQRFAEDGFHIPHLMAAICKSSWYQAKAVDTDVSTTDERRFVRNLKVISPEQVFDSLEQSLLLPVSRIDPQSPRWTGSRTQLVSRLSETIGATPEDYASGIPQALLLMNGKVTNDAIDPDRSRLLRAVVESPFFNERDRIRTLYLAVLTRSPASAETAALTKYLDSQPNKEARQKAYGEILWALLNSPEFVLCR
ncbi:MAG: DUF1553 domain-containing protein [Planctomycetaceae bacterium]